MRALVTGGASGIGCAITRRLARESGAEVWFTFARSRDAAESITREFPNAHAVHADFTDAASIESLLAAMEGWHLSAIVNSAITGFSRTHAHKLAPGVLQSSFEHNVLPAVRLTHRALHAFRKARAGRIVTILSAYVVNRPPLGMAEYVANKAYLHSMTKSWAVENADFGITANCVSPSVVRTALTGDLGEDAVRSIAEASPLHRLLTEMEVADAVFFLLTASPHLNGVNLVINAGQDIA